MEEMFDPSEVKAMKACMKDVAWESVQIEWCGVVEWVKKYILRWSGYLERKKSEEFVKKVHVCE